jgi:hypothetical protein
VAAGKDGDGDCIASRKYKMDKYSKEVGQTGNSKFLPIVANFFGGWDSKSTVRLKEIGLAAARTYNLRNPTSMFFFRRLNVSSIQRANAATILSRKPSSYVQSRAQHGGPVGSRSNSIFSCFVDRVVVGSS